MTRKDYPMIAETIRMNRQRIEFAIPSALIGVDYIARAIADALKFDNPAFDKARFLKDCGVST